VLIQQISSGDSAGAVGLNKSGIFVERRSWTLAEKQVVVAAAFNVSRYIAGGTGYLRLERVPIHFERNTL